MSIQDREVRRDMQFGLAEISRVADGRLYRADGRFERNHGAALRFTVREHDERLQPGLGVLDRMHGCDWLYSPRLDSCRIDGHFIAPTTRPIP